MLGNHHKEARDGANRTGAFHRMTITFALILTLATIALANTVKASAAQADSSVTVCGHPDTYSTPSYTAAGAAQMDSQFSNDEINGLVNALSLSEKACVPLQILTTAAVEVVVNGELMDFFFGVHVPELYDGIIAITKAALEEAKNQQDGQPSASLPATLPAVGGSDTTIWAPVAWATAGIKIRSQPNTTSSSIGAVPDGTELQIECSTYGENVTSGGGNTAVWDQVTYSGVTGYVVDAYMNTGQLTPVVPSCT